MVAEASEARSITETSSVLEDEADGEAAVAMAMAEVEVEVEEVQYIWMSLMSLYSNGRAVST